MTSNVKVHFTDKTSISLFKRLELSKTCKSIDFDGSNLDKFLIKIVAQSEYNQYPSFEQLEDVFVIHFFPMS